MCTQNAGNKNPYGNGTAVQKDVRQSFVCLRSYYGEFRQLLVIAVYNYRKGDKRLNYYSKINDGVILKTRLRIAKDGDYTARRLM